ncbi:MAG: ATPase, partial [Bacteroidota bacterium]
MPTSPPTILCLASFHKGHDFLRQCRKEGCRVVLLTSKSLEQAEWPTESIDQIFYIPDVDKEWKMDDVIYGVSYMARTEAIDCIVALDDYDVEKAAALREHLRIPGMGDTTARYFRDKLAMRTKAAEAGLAIPDFVHVLNYKKLVRFMDAFPPPYLLKPRFQAGAIGIRNINKPDELWKSLDELGDKQSFYVLERFVPGEVFHVDSIVHDNRILFAVVSQYGKPPMEVAHEGRVFSSRTILRGSPDEVELQRENRAVLNAMGMKQGVSHTEFIKQSDNGQFVFLETSARVGGAHIVDLVEAATGLNLWTEWAKIEVRPGYTLTEHRDDYAGLLISLAKQEWPDLSGYNDPEVVWKLQKKNHAGLIVRSPRYERVEELLKDYTERFYRDFFATQPLPK